MHSTREGRLTVHVGIGQCRGCDTVPSRASLKRGDSRRNDSDSAAGEAAGGGAAAVRTSLLTTFELALTFIAQQAYMDA